VCTGIFPDETLLLQSDCNFHQSAQFAPTVKKELIIRSKQDRRSDHLRLPSYNYEHTRLTQTIKRTSILVVAVTAVSMAAVAADEKTNPDNTAINKRDRSGETNTSGDQSNTSADLKVTQAVRRALMQDSQLSTTAKNIKVITANGQVTLRGPVNTAEEKAKIDQIAKSAAGGAQIVNQLEVKGTK
jgi:hyperosmotically inducible periplasmic protein